MKTLLKLILSISIIVPSNSIVYDTDYILPTFIEKKSKSDIRLISYNTWGLPIPVANSDQHYRFKNIPNALNATEADIICLQETFNPNLRRQLKAKLKEFNIFCDINCNKRKLLFIKSDC